MAQVERAHGPGAVPRRNRLADVPSIHPQEAPAHAGAFPIWAAVNTPAQPIVASVLYECWRSATRAWEVGGQVRSLSPPRHPDGNGGPERPVRASSSKKLPERRPQITAGNASGTGLEPGGKRARQHKTRPRLVPATQRSHGSAKRLRRLARMAESDAEACKNATSFCIGLRRLAASAYGWATSSVQSAPARQ